jgi:hypothetical protein
MPDGSYFVFPPAFCLAQRALWASEIFLRAAGDIVRFFFPPTMMMPCS